MTSLLRRSELAVPAANDHMFAKAAASEADLVFLDLEDATAPAHKEAARGKAVTALNELDWGRTVRAIRINGLDTQWCHDDIIEVVTGARENLDTIIIPKALRARDVWWVDVLLTQLEAKLGLSRQIRLEVLIEEVEGLANAEEIASASPRLDALIFGVGDFSLSQGARVDTNFDPLGEYPGDFWAYARNKVIVAARIAGIDAIDAPVSRLRQPGGLRARRATGRADGLHRQVGHSPEPDRGRQPGLRADRRGDRAGRAQRRGLPRRRAEGSGRGRRQRCSGRRGPRQDGSGHPGARGADQGRRMKTFTDDEMKALLPTAKTYTVMILKQGPNFTDDTAPAVIWEHGRRNFGLRHDGVLAVVLPVPDGSDVCGVGVFTGTVEETVAVMNDDPGVQAGVFTFEVHGCLGFPGDSLP